MQTVPGGLVAPKGLDRDIVARLERLCEAAVRSERYASIMRTTRQPLVYQNAASFAREIAADYEAKRALIAKGNVKLQ